jgi:hypothetical protein
MTNMTSNMANGSRRAAALSAGLGIVLMAVVAGFSYGMVLNGLTVPGDAAATAANLRADASLFRAGIMGWVVILILDIIVAWGLYLFFRATDQPLSLLSAWFRLVYSAVLGTAIALLVVALLVADAGAYVTVFTPEQADGLVLLFLSAYDSVYALALVIFGCHLALLGVLAYRTSDTPAILGFLLILAALGYLLIGPAELLLPAYAEAIALLELLFTLPMIVGELGFGLWLIFQGGRSRAD